MDVKAVITDWGGVLTSPLNEAVAHWIAAESIDEARYKAVMREWVSQAYDARGGILNPVHGLEDGSLPVAEFERMLAAELCTVDGRPVECEGLIKRMFAAFHPVEPMYAALRAARAAGARIALLSNSWGNDYPRELWGELFDEVVISCEVGMRKPDERIFRHAVERLGLAPAECAFVDDIEHNVRAAEALGMVGVHHVDVNTTIARLGELLGVRLADC
ncbi:HAD family hydrolase [Thermomonospora cellulosilytica]|uniref:Putative hydrolase of the HAD superfamily n=1 Tax=Thermomonospora cellulosilytica TaxID=1411118 RepID=A0A7W3RCF2_9ACTN|nr:HAD family phosphatase [Thermomonospora cellulosilytica]MBA9007861.1 putative hydrolase of the HAD superfamily [Thermomonospora cellulosilytica]